MKKLLALSLALLASPAFATTYRYTASSNGGFAKIPATNIGSQLTFPLSTYPNTADPKSSYTYNMFLPGQVQSFTLYTAGANAWEVVDLYNNVVESGAISTSATSLTIPTITKYGFYRLRFGYPSVIDANYGNSFGAQNFAVVPSDANLVPPGAYSLGSYDFPYNNSPTGGIANSFSTPALYGMCGTGPFRYTAPQDGNTTNGAAWATQLLNNLNYDSTNGWAGIAADSARPAHKHIVSFNVFSGSSSDIAYVTAVVAVLGTRCVYIGTNEPQANSPASQATIQTAFTNAVHAGNASALAGGPCAVTVGPSLASWYSSFWAANPSMDFVCFHNYNGVQGDEQLIGDVCMANFIAGMPTAYKNLPRWNDEQGTTQAMSFGIYQMARSAQQLPRVALQMEYYGVPKEQQSIFYPISHGFWGFSSWIVNQQGNDAANAYDLNPEAITFRQLAISLRGTNPQSTKLSLGNASDYATFYQYSKSGGGYVTACYANAYNALPCTVTGATSAVDSFGNSVNVSGQFNLTMLPIYITSASPLTISDIGNGLMTKTNIATSATATVATGMSTTNIAHINDGSFHSDVGQLGNGESQPPFDSNSPYIDLATNTSTGLYYKTMPGQVTLTWSTAQTGISKVIFCGKRGWHLQNAPIQLSVDALVSGTWQNGVGTYLNTSNSSSAFSTWQNSCTYESGYNNEYHIPITLSSPVNATAIRVNILQTTCGEAPDTASFLNSNVDRSYYKAVNVYQGTVIDDIRVVQ